MRQINRKWTFLLLIIALVFLQACSDEKQKFELTDSAVILAFGDSLTFGTGANPEQSYPAQLAKLTGRTVINAGVPGEISEKALERLPELLNKHHPQLVILCHGGNDLLRKLNVGELESNLGKMVDLIQQSGADVLLVSVPKPGLLMQASPVYQRVAEAKGVAIEDSIIAKVEAEIEWKSDPIHPNAIGYKKIAEQLALWID
ncbi:MULTISPECIES: arylesterase [Methylophaga]|jgi:lysophospholipase L1-like esterase|uniref:Arylesterase n=2 Tax=Methylophaga TaxID=40222 RepID=A0ABN0TJJ2_9GAMM|nr:MULTISPECIES: arylesterase [Methylophaga]BDZ75363.1 arylesterase [Methylophaga marina]|tara:strand:- start:22498 stop:23103 length:606 start_codon:yes stop_codon:yes gene_type:complete